MKTWRISKNWWLQWTPWSFWIGGFRKGPYIMIGCVGIVLIYQVGVSDKDMADAMTCAMQRLLPSLGRDLTTDKVKKYLATFVEFPKKSYDIPQAARQKFLDGLVELKP